MTTTNKRPPKIADFRLAIDSLNWSRNDLTGATSEETLRMNVKAILEPHIQTVQSMLHQVPPRFAKDIERANSAIERAHAAIEGWISKTTFAWPRFAITFEDAGFTDSEQVCEAQFTEQEALGFTAMSRAEETFPPFVLAVVRGYVDKDEGQGKATIKAFAGVVLIVAARDEEHAYKFTPPNDLLTRVSDAMTTIDGTCPLALESSWEVFSVEPADDAILTQYGVKGPSIQRPQTKRILHLVSGASLSQAQ